MRPKEQVNGRMNMKKYYKQNDRYLLKSTKLFIWILIYLIISSSGSKTSTSTPNQSRTGLDKGTKN